MEESRISIGMSWLGIGYIIWVEVIPNNDKFLLHISSMSRELNRQKYSVRELLKTLQSQARLSPHSSD